jgi:autotransporter-associated beta strand protein
VSVENVGTQPVSVLLDDDSPDTPLYGRLADGNGPLGLVKRGSGTRTVETQDAAYSGPTVVHAGTLKVAGPLASGASVTAHYLRIVPTQVKGGVGWADNNMYNWGMNEFQLLDGSGNVVPWPSDKQLTADNNGAGASTFANLVDGDITTRCIVKNVDSSKTSPVLPPVTISSASGFTFSGYRWYTPHQNIVDENRTPVALEIEVSDDGTNWTTVDARNVPWVADETSYANGKPGILRGPYGLFGTSSGVSPLYTISSAFFADTTARSTRAPALKARHFRFTPLFTVGEGAAIAELDLY